MYLEKLLKKTIEKKLISIYLYYDYKYEYISLNQCSTVKVTGTAVQLCVRTVRTRVVHYYTYMWVPMYLYTYAVQVCLL